ncbi:MAG TPA: ATP-binding protein, partial [Puia sp.]
LTYSRTHSLRKDFEKINLRTIVEDVEQNLKEEIGQAQARVEIPESCDLNVITFQFQQVFYNLISNSLKFSNPGKPLIITITGRHASGSELENNLLKKDTRYTHIRFADNGIGFEPQYNERIFELFQRLHGKNEYKGTGVGLAIVKRIVDNHNGVVIAKGNEGVGATFDIYLPEKAT